MGPNLKKSLSFLWILAAVWLSLRLVLPFAGPFLLGAAAACVDESIQLFVPDRGPGLRDVFIDCSGVLTGLILLHLGHHYWRKIRAKQPLEET